MLSLNFSSSFLRFHTAGTSVVKCHTVLSVLIPIKSWLFCQSTRARFTELVFKLLNSFGILNSALFYFTYCYFIFQYFFYKMTNICHRNVTKITSLLLTPLPLVGAPLCCLMKPTKLKCLKVFSRFVFY